MRLLVSLLVLDRNDPARLLHGLHVSLHRAVRVLQLLPADTPLTSVYLEFPFQKKRSAQHRNIN